MNKDMVFEIPILPPGINQSYKPVIRDMWNEELGRLVKKPSLVKSREAREWEKAATPVIKAASGYQDFNTSYPYYQIRIDVFGWKGDVDAHFKLVQDTLMDVLEFPNDNNVVAIYAVKRIDIKDKKGLKIHLRGLTVKEAECL